MLGFGWGSWEGHRALGGRIPHLQGADSGNDDLIRLGLLLKSKIGI